MDNAELTRLGILLEEARSPEEVFGTLAGTAAEKLISARKIFLHLAKVVHPDTHRGLEEVRQANASFKRLALFWEQAQAKIDNGTYGQKVLHETATPFIIHTATNQYSLGSLLSQGDICNLYAGALIAPTRKQVILKVPIKPQDNDLNANEARILAHLRSGSNYPAARAFLSQLIDAFSYKEQATGIIRRITVLTHVKNLVTLKAVKEAYPGGIDARDMAWIWRRLLVALDFAHTNGVIHGSVLPTHILIQPEQHGVMLIDWSYAVLQPERTHTWISAISTAYRTWYPAEVFARQEPQPGLDIYMAASCMIYLLGGDPQLHTLPASVPWQIQNHLRGCTLPHPRQRPQDARTLLHDFDELLERLWGPRNFHAFRMPGV
jgi:serine/threonine protein kinase